MIRINRMGAYAWTIHRIVTVFVSLLRGPDNKAFYSTTDGVDLYIGDNPLQLPEREVLERLKEWLNGRRMLDLGVGAGRTTKYFAPLVGTYVGMDYAPPMIAACKSRFGDEMDNVTFTVGDARDLSRFDTASFDFVLFSFNGLDCIGHDDRLAALAEIRRVCAPDGFFCFSSHNLGEVSHLFRLRPDEKKNAYSRIKGSLAQVILRLLNSSQSTLSRKGHAVVRESTNQFSSIHYYIYPSEQVKQLANAGFSHAEVYALDGRQTEPSVAADTGCPWIYYLATSGGQYLANSSLHTRTTAN